MSSQVDQLIDKLSRYCVVCSEVEYRRDVGVEELAAERVITDQLTS